MAAKGEMSKEYRERVEILNEISSEMWDSKRQLSKEGLLTGMREFEGQSTKGGKYRGKVGKKIVGIF